MGCRIKRTKGSKVHIAGCDHESPCVNVVKRAERCRYAVKLEPVQVAAMACATSPRLLIGSVSPFDLGPRRTGSGFISPDVRLSWAAT